MLIAARVLPGQTLIVVVRLAQMCRYLQKWVLELMSLLSVVAVDYCLNQPEKTVVQL